MPFKSEKQKGWLWANRPDIAKKWTSEYGSKPQAKKPKPLIGIAHIKAQYKK